MSAVLRAGVAAGGLLLAVSAQAQTVVRHDAVVNGAASATGGGLRVTGVVGRAAVGTMAGGGLVLTGGAVPSAAGSAPSGLTLTSITPGAGLASGGTRVQIRGTGFSGGASVAFGGTPATSVVLVDTTTLIAFTPARPAGRVDVAVTVAGDTAMRASAFEFLPQPAPSADTDGDGMPDAWELRFNLDPLDPADALSDPDGDGRTNREEFEDDSHPTAPHTRYLAEGASGDFFETRLALLNPGAVPATTLVRYQRSDGAAVTRFERVAPLTRLTVDPSTSLGGGNVEFSTIVESDTTLVVDRTMTWDRAQGYGSHAETSVAAPATTWYLAEGATHTAFDLFYLLQNATRTPAEVRVTYLLPSGAPLQKTYAVAPGSRFNIWVDVEQFPDGSGNLPLASTDVSAVIEVLNDVPIVAERAMYASSPGQFFGAGHESAGVTTAGLAWFFAEGATGPYFDLFLLIANPNDFAAHVRARYLLTSGAVVSKDYTVAPRSRFNIWVDLEGPDLADAAVSTTLEVLNGAPIIAERAMWWPGGFTTWHEAHNSPGNTATGTLWAVAEGEVGGPRDTATYLLVANTSTTPGSARVTLVFEDGSTAARSFALNASSRLNVDVGTEFPEATGRRFGALVESLGSPAAQLVVERAMYSNAGAVVWAAGTNAAATRLR